MHGCFYLTFNKKGKKSLNLETKHHSHSVENIQFRTYLALPRSSDSVTKNNRMQEYQHKTQKRNLFRSNAPRSFMSGTLSKGNYTFKVIGASRSSGPRRNQQQRGAPWLRLVLVYLVVFQRDCPATSERGTLRGKTPCSPT